MLPEVVTLAAAHASVLQYATWGGTLAAAHAKFKAVIMTYWRQRKFQAGVLQFAIWAGWSLFISKDKTIPWYCFQKENINIFNWKPVPQLDVIYFISKTEQNKDKEILKIISHTKLLHWIQQQD